MSQERIAGMIWGFVIGAGVVAGITVDGHFFIYPVFGLFGSWFFSKVRPS